MGPRSVGIRQPGGVEIGDEPVGDGGELAFVGVRQPRPQLPQRHPRHLRDLDVGVRQLPSEISQQIVMHSLVDAPAFRDEPVVDAAEFGEDGAAHPRLLVHLPHRRLLGRLTLLDVPLGKRPEQPAAAVRTADQRGAQLIGGPAETVHDQTPGRRLPHGS